MKRKNIIIILILSALIFVFILKRQINKPVQTDTFAYNDTSIINKITLSKEDDTIFLIKENGVWLVNNKSIKQKSLLNILYAIKSFEIKSPLTSDNVLKYTDTVKNKGIYVDIEGTDNINKSFILYENIDQEINTFLYDRIENNLYLMKIPGYYGKIIPYFNTNESYWKYNILMDYKGFEILSVHVSYTDSPENSYIVMYDSLSRYSLFNEKNENLYCNDQNISRYFTYFKNINYEREYSNIELNTLDTTHKYAEITIEKLNHNISVYSFYKIFNNNKNSNARFDYNYALVKKESNNTFYKVKYFEIDLLLKDIMYFK